MQQKDVLFWVWLSEATGPSCKDFKTLIDLYENPYDIFHAEEAEIERVPHLTQRVVDALRQKDLQSAYDILSRCEKLGIEILTYHDERYPKLLREIKAPPSLLYYKGELPDFNHLLCVGMVGTRNMSEYGMETAYKISYELASAGAVTVSGMATGIDGVCAAATIAAKGKTVAVLGCGVDIVYPYHHNRLGEAITKNGALLSEYAPGVKPVHYHFPVRNRIISGMTHGTVVVEAGVQSGSLITARNAILQGRDVFALPANVGSKGAEGTNGLLRDGANLLLDTGDILRKYDYIFAESINYEAFEKAKEHSRADRRWLDSLGVIALQRSSAGEVAEAKKGSQRVAEPTEGAAKKDARTKERRATPSGDAVIPKEIRSSAMKESKKEQINQETKAASAPSGTMPALSPIQYAVLEAIPDDSTVTADALCALGHPYGETIAALTMLEIMGLVKKLPGALYIRA